MDHRQAVGVNRPFGPFRHVIIHDSKEPGGQEEADRVMAIPPLRQRVLHTGPDDVAFGATERHRQGRVVDQVQHRDGHDEGQVEPIGDVNMRLVPPPQGGDEDHQVNHPHHRQPQVDVPFRLGVFLALGNAQDIAAGGQNDKQLIAPEHEPGDQRQGQARLARALHHMQRGHDQHIAAKGENHRRGMDRTQAPEIGPRQIEVQCRIG